VVLFRNDIRALIIFDNLFFSFTVARRDMWQVISNIVAGNVGGNPDEKPSVILTTHSMEECEALCPQIGIMAGGKLRCLGSAQVSSNIVNSCA
jgi:ABC-type multidrug transport system ATPase subunit